MYRISVIMASYNGESVVEAQLESLLNQTIPIDEVIIRDDCSKDRTEHIIMNFIDKHKLNETWHYRRNEHNMGYGDNFMQLAYESTGDYVFFCDQDDVWKSNKLEIMAAAMKSNPQIEVLTSRYKSFYNEHEIKDLADDASNRRISQIPLKQANMHLGSIGCVMGVRSTMLREVRKYCFKGFAQDEFVWKMALCRRSLYHINFYGIYRRLHSGNTSGHKMHKPEKRLEYLNNTIKSFESMARYANEHRDAAAYSLSKRNLKAIKYRKEVVEKMSLTASIILLFKYFSTYQYKRAWFREIIIGYEGQRKRNRKL